MSKEYNAITVEETGTEVKVTAICPDINSSFNDFITELRAVAGDIGEKPCTLIVDLNLNDKTPMPSGMISVLVGVANNLQGDNKLKLLGLNQDAREIIELTRLEKKFIIEEGVPIGTAQTPPMSDTSEPSQHQVSPVDWQTLDQFPQKNQYSIQYARDLFIEDMGKALSRLSREYRQAFIAAGTFKAETPPSQLFSKVREEGANFANRDLEVILRAFQKDFSLPSKMDEPHATVVAPSTPAPPSH